MSSLAQTTRHLLSLPVCTVLLIACQKVSEPVRPEADPLVRTDERAINYSDDVQFVFMAALQDADVSAGKVMLDAEGYRWVDTNSVFLVRRYYRMSDTPIKPVTNRPSPYRVVISEDTLVWMAFENPTADPANHTALLYGIHGGITRTMLLEWNVGVYPPSSIREGKIVGGIFQPVDPAIDGMWGCVGSAVGGGAVGCLFSNCCWGKCAGGVVAGSLVGCGLAALFGI